MTMNHADKIRIFSYINLLILFLVAGLYGENYPDQQYVLKNDVLLAHAETVTGIRLSEDGRSLCLDDGATYGSVILKPDSSGYPFDRGLPSWNGTAPDQNSSFIVQIRFPYGSGWSPWLTVGYWKSFFWPGYGTTSYAEGFIDYDYVKLSSYQQKWQFQIHMTRTSAAEPSPTLAKLSFFISDSRTTESMDYTMLLNDNPEQIFIPTGFLYQYAIDDEIGGSICSPTAVSMVLKSYGIPVDPLKFAQDTWDPYWEIFGMWPRVVQNASEYGLDGAVTRYRNWSETRDVLAANGRIVITVGEPLPFPNGHLMMLAGFTASGNPIVHDPARSNGYSYIYDKDALAHAWFEKGGIAYTFYQADSQTTTVTPQEIAGGIPGEFRLMQNYPNPFNPVTRIPIELATTADIEISVFDSRGRMIRSLFRGVQNAGTHVMTWDASGLPSGTYFIQLNSGNYRQAVKTVLLK
jgi:hypothetical protein